MPGGRVPVGRADQEPAGKDSPASRRRLRRGRRACEEETENGGGRGDQTRVAHFSDSMDRSAACPPVGSGHTTERGLFAVEEKRTTLTDDEILTSTPGDTRSRFSVTDADQDDETDSSDSDTDGTDSDSDGTDT